jgi:hypothetical protein
LAAFLASKVRFDSFPLLKEQEKEGGSGGCKRQKRDHYIFLMRQESQWN